MAFSIFVGQPELAWAKRAFDALAGRGFVDDLDTFSRHLSVFRFPVLAGIYHDFCQAAWEETSYIDYAEWCKPPELIEPFVVGQRFARLSYQDEEEEVEFSDALNRLVEAERETVVQALRKAFGGVSGLYPSLWRSHSRAASSDEEEKGDNYECFEPDDAGKLEAYEWISEGCPRLGMNCSTGGDLIRDRRINHGP